MANKTNTKWGKTLLDVYFEFLEDNINNWPMMSEDKNNYIFGYKTE